MFVRIQWNDVWIAPGWYAVSTLITVSYVIYCAYMNIWKSDWTGKLWWRVWLHFLASPILLHLPTSGELIRKPRQFLLCCQKELSATDGNPLEGPSFNYCKNPASVACPCSLGPLDLLEPPPLPWRPHFAVSVPPHPFLACVQCQESSHSSQALSEGPSCFKAVVTIEANSPQNAWWHSLR